MPDRKLPEEFAPTGPRLSRFPLRPAPPIRPHLFTDEARFARRLALLAGATEAVAWVAVAARLRAFVALLVAFRMARPFWARAGSKVSRARIGFALLLLPVPFAAAVVALAARGASRSGSIAGTSVAMALFLATLGGAALGDVCAACVADHVTVERRATAYAWLDIATAIGAAAGAAIAQLEALLAAALILPAWIAALFCSRELRDRGVPRSSWPLSAYRAALASPLGWRLAISAAACGIASAWAGLTELPMRNPSGWGWLAFGAPFAGMALAARAEPLAPNALWVPLAAVAVAWAGVLLHSRALALAGLGMMLTGIPAAVARAAGEMERPLVSSVAWSALFAGAAAGAVLGS